MPLHAQAAIAPLLVGRVSGWLGLDKRCTSAALRSRDACRQAESKVGDPLAWVSRRAYKVRHRPVVPVERSSPVPIGSRRTTPGLVDMSLIPSGLIASNDYLSATTHAAPRVWVTCGGVCWQVSLATPNPSPAPSLDAANACIICSRRCLRSTRNSQAANVPASADSADGDSATSGLFATFLLAPLARC